MTRVVVILIIITICLLLILRPMPTRAVVCPSVNNTVSVRVDILNDNGRSIRHYAVDPVSAFQAVDGNDGYLQYLSRPARWLVLGNVVAGAGVQAQWSFKYRLTFYDGNREMVGDAWIATLPQYSEFYFYFIMPEGESTHPNCAYGSVTRARVDARLGVRQ